MAKDDLQKGVERIIKEHGGKQIDKKTFDMTKEVEKEKGGPKDKSK